MSNSTIGSNGATVSKQLQDTMNGTNSATSATSSTGSSSTSAASLQSTFLQLLVTQLQNQDPTSPLDSSQMTSQLAQINTVSGIGQLNTSLSSLSAQLEAGQNAQAAGLLGATVLAPGNTLAVTSGTATVFGVQLASAASDMQATITNASGQIVSTMDLGKLPAGTTPISWTPVDTSGNPLPSGNYTISLSGTVNGAAGTGTPLTPGKVESVVQQAGGGAGLVLSNGSTVALTSIAAIL